MTKTWAKELGRKGIRANAVCPGFVGTTILNSMPERVLRAMEEKVPLGRRGKPEEIADAFASGDLSVRRRINPREEASWALNCSAISRLRLLGACSRLSFSSTTAASSRMAEALLKSPRVATPWAFWNSPASLIRRV